MASLNYAVPDESTHEERSKFIPNEPVWEGSVPEFVFALVLPGHEVPDLDEIQLGYDGRVDADRLLALFEAHSSSMYDFGNGHRGLCLDFGTSKALFIEAPIRVEQNPFSESGNPAPNFGYEF
jgi:hypothetical protein